MDNISTTRRSRNMRAIRSKGMEPEVAVRRIAHRLGFRFRLHDNKLPGKPDLVFRRFRKVVLVHGCFWHQHPSSCCKIVRTPKSNRRYWIPKLARNRARDEVNRRLLRRLGWNSLVIWECETERPALLHRKLLAFLR